MAPDTKSIPRGVANNNFLEPGSPINSRQPVSFPYGYGTWTVVFTNLQLNWFLENFQATATPVGLTDSNRNSIPPNPTCPPAFTPSTALSFSSPGSYAHQYLGQVNSGPAPNPINTIAITALSGNPYIAITNLTYTPSDQAYASTFLNSNSIYGDITIGGSIQSATNTARLQLLVNGVSVMRGMTPISYKGTLTSPDTTTTALTSTLNPVASNGATQLQASVSDATHSNETPAGSVISAMPSTARRRPSPRCP